MNSENPLGEIPRAYESLEETMQQLAAKTQLNYQRGNYRNDFKLPPTVKGKIGTWNILVTCDLKIEEENTRNQTRFTLDFPNEKRNWFTIQKENVFSRLGTKMGIGGIRTGHQKFDDLFSLKGGNSKLMMKLVNQEIQTALLAIHSTKGGFGKLVLQNNHLWYEENKIFLKADWGSMIIDVLQEIADQMAEITFFEKIHGENTELESEDEF